MYVARTSFVAVDRNRVPVRYKAGDTIADFSTWPLGAREGALGMGQVIDSADLVRADAHQDPPGVAGDMKRLWWRMMGQKRRPHDARWAGMGEQAFSAHEAPVPAQPTVEVDGFACDVCHKVMPTARGMKIHRATQHRGA